MYCRKIKGLHFDIARLQQEYKQIIDKVPYEGRRHLHLTHREGNINKYFGDGIDSYIEYQGDKIISNNHFTIMNDFVKGTYFEEVLETVKEFFPTALCKFVRIPANFIYRVHVDCYNHIHIPITGNEAGAMFNPYEKPEVYWLRPDGCAYYCNTLMRHTFFNCPGDNNEERVTLLISVKQDLTKLEDCNHI